MSDGANAAVPGRAASGIATPGARRRLHIRGALCLAIGAVAGLAAFAWIAGWPAKAQLASGNPAADIVAWVNALPVETNRTRAPDQRPSLVLTTENRGKVAFGRYCDSCHYAGNENIGASLRSAQFKRTFNTPEKIADFVRRGGFDMPAYSQSFLSDADLAAIVEHVRSLPETAR